MPTGFSIVTFAIFIVVLIGVVQAIRVVPQQKAWVVERLGRFHGVLAPGLHFVGFTPSLGGALRLISREAQTLARAAALSA